MRKSKDLDLGIHRDTKVKQGRPPEVLPSAQTATQDTEHCDRVVTGVPGAFLPAQFHLNVPSVQHNNTGFQFPP